MTMTAIGSTAGLRKGEVTSRPSTADSTEIAGVIMPSPKNRQAPTIATRVTAAATRGRRVTRCASTIMVRKASGPS